MYSEKEITKAMSLYADSFGCKDKVFAKYLANDHPTTQQSLVRLCVAFLREMANKEYTDDRNECAVRASRIMIAALDKERAGSFPLI